MLRKLQSLADSPSANLLKTRLQALIQLAQRYPWVIALYGFISGVAARSALEGSGLALDQLGSRSLGELLFSDRAFLRGELEVTRYPAAWLPSEVRAEHLWARRSCFRRGALAVLVAEVFLPAFWIAVGQP